MNLIHRPRQRQLKPHWPDPGAAWRSRADYDAVEARFAAEWRAHAFAVWRATRPAKGTSAQAYLKSCGIHIPPPPTLRFHPRLEHFAGGSWPALICLITDGRSGLPLGIFCTYLARDGSSLAPIRQPMVTLGVCDGGVVRLGEPSDVLTIGVGLLTCLGVMQDSADAVWATLSERGLAELDLPAVPGGVIVLGDGTDAAQAAAWRWKWQGRRVALVVPLREMEVCGCPCPVTRPGVNCH